MSEPISADTHRAIGGRLNNATWDALDAGQITADSHQRDKHELLYGAITSLYHWMQVGTEANRARGEHLVARVAVQIGMPEAALAHARTCLEICEANPDDVEDWDLAFAHEATARAAAAQGDGELAEQHYRAAERQGEAIADDASRQVFADALAAGPWFGYR